MYDLAAFHELKDEELYDINGGSVIGIIIVIVVVAIIIFAIGVYNGYQGAARG
jgi:lactobin A/cerein 7B family class IIb bacteriocin